MRTLLLVLAGAASLAAADLPVVEVILYKNGVGYFRRSGELKAGQTASLEFKAAEMNDVLKSLMVAEEGGKGVAGVRYDSSETTARRLAGLPFRFGERQPLSALLDQVKGARIEVKIGADTVAGILLGARERLNPPREEVSLVSDSGEIRTLDLGGATSVRFADSKLQAQLADSLSILAQSRSLDKRAVTVESSDTRARRITAAYLVPTAAWKSSYRLAFGDKAEPQLEGWAIVDNTSGEDWTNVRLALVSGRPVSFISQLYEPRYPVRPVADLPEDQAAAPELHQGAVGGMVATAGMAMSEQRASRLAAPAAPPPAPMMKSVDGVADRWFSSVAATAQGSEIGELFEYRFPAGITVHKDESAMFPFLQQSVAARRLLIYADASSENPRNAAELTNSTGKTLDGGPLTVFDGNAYAGEALMTTLKAGDKRLISYAVDLGTRISTASESSRDVVRELHLRRGILTTRVAVQETRTYTIRNVDRKPKTLIVEHPIRSDYKLLKLKPAETTATAYRFEVALGPDSTEKFPVAEERLLESSTGLSNITPDLLLTYVQNKALDANARAALERIAKQKDAVARNDAEIQRAQERLNNQEKDEDRVRQNIASLNRVSGQQDQVQNYARQLATLETGIAAARDEIARLRQARAALVAELNRLIEAADF
jgi:hypothetical protein